MSCLYLLTTPSEVILRQDGLRHFLKELFNVSFDVAGQEVPAVALEGFPIRADEELLKIPRDVVPAHGTPDDELGVSHQGHRDVAGEGKLLLEKHEQLVRVLAIHINLFQELEARYEAIPRTHVLQAVQNFFIFGVFLVLKKERAAFNQAVVTKPQSLSTHYRILFVK